MVVVHEDLTQDRVLEAAESEMFGTENPGFCLACGARREGCEPDAIAYPCDSCGKRTVMGASQIIVEGLFGGRQLKGWPVDPYSR